MTFTAKSDINTVTTPSGTLTIRPADVERVQIDNSADAAISQTSSKTFDELGAFSGGIYFLRAEELGITYTLTPGTTAKFE